MWDETSLKIDLIESAQRFIEKLRQMLNIASTAEPAAAATASASKAITSCSNVTILFYS